MLGKELLNQEKRFCSGIQGGYLQRCRCWGLESVNHTEAGEYGELINPFEAVPIEVIYVCPVIGVYQSYAGFKAMSRGEAPFFTQTDIQAVIPG